MPPMTRPRVAVPDLNEVPAAEVYGDPLTAEEMEQAEVGSLFSIQGPDFADVSWSIFRHRTRPEMIDDPSGGKMEWVFNAVGGLEGADLIDQIGGGTFQFRGYVPREDGRGVRIKYNRTVRLAGPRRDFTLPEPGSVTTTPNPTVSQTDTLLHQLLDEMRASREDRFEKLLQVLVLNNTKQGNGGVGELIDGVAKLQGLVNRGAPAAQPSDGALLETMIGVLRQGIEIGETRDGSPIKESGTDWVEVAKTVTPIFQTIIDNRRARHAAATRRPAPPSSAEVVEDPKSQAQAEPTINHRWRTAIESLFRAMSTNEDPRDFASLLGSPSGPLNADELSVLHLASAAQVLGAPEMQPLLVEFPLLNTEQARVYLDQVLAEIRNPSELEESPATT